jgi:hypothetical protein
MYSILWKAYTLRKFKYQIKSLIGIYELLVHIRNSITDYRTLTRITGSFVCNLFIVIVPINLIQNF